MMRRVDLAKLVGLVAIGIVVYAFWNYPFLKPLKVFTVFTHEASHAIAAVATGGRVADMQVHLSEGGHVLSQGGSRFWTLMAGYLGSLVFGGVILLIASRTALSKPFAVILGGGMLLATLVYVTNLVGILFGVAFGLALIAAGAYLSRTLADWLLRVLGLTNCFYAIYDIMADVVLRPHLRSDAQMLAEYTSFPPFLPLAMRTWFWGLLWLAIAVVATVWFLSQSVRHERKVREQEDYTITIEEEFDFGDVGKESL